MDIKKQINKLANGANVFFPETLPRQPFRDALNTVQKPLPLVTGVCVPANDLKALAESHSSLLGAAKLLQELVGDYPALPGLRSVIEEAEKL